MKAPKKEELVKACTIVSAAVAVFLGLAACSDQAPVSGPGTMTATLVGPSGAEGAALVVILDADLGEISPVGRTDVFAAEGSGATRVVLVNRDGGTLSFQVAVADTTRPPPALVEQVAGPDDELRSSLEGYAVEFTR